MKRTDRVKGWTSLGAAMALGAALAAAPTPKTWWKMDALDANGRVADATDGGCDLVLGADVSFVEDVRFGHVLYFGGSTNSWGCSASNPAFPGSRTIAFWTCLDATEDPINDADGNLQNKIPYVISGVSGTMVNFGFGSDIYRLCPQSSYAHTGVSVPRCSWHHSVFVLRKKTADETVRWDCDFYLDGFLAKSVVDQDEPNIIDTATQIVVGNGAVAGVRPMRGRLADVRLFNAALTAGEAFEIYQEAPKSLIGWWPMEEVTQNALGERITPEASGRGVPMRIGGANVLVPGVDGQALDFVNARDCWGAVTNVVDWTSFSVAFWARPRSGMANLYPDGGEARNTVGHFFTLGMPMRMAIGNMADNARSVQMFDLVTTTNGSDQGTTWAKMLAPRDTWVHLAVVAKTGYSAADDCFYVQPDYYVNGEYFASGRASGGAYYKGSVIKAGEFLFGNSAHPNQPRAFYGQFDDVVLYNGTLTADEVRTLYRGVAKPDAGADFAVTGATAQLAGALAAANDGVGRACAASQAKWTLVSAPEGGEEAAIETPDDLATRVTLPVAGAYTFRLTATALCLTKTDDVTVTRVASPGAAVTVTLPAAATATAQEPTAFAATASAGARVTWKRTSGPGAVRFEPAAGAATTATFPTEGTYVVRATAEKDGATATADVTVTVAAAEGDVDLARGLRRHWTFGNDAKDAVTGVEGANVDVYNVTLTNGVDGYGVRVKNAFGNTMYFDTKEALPETTDDATYQMPSNRWLTISAWIYHDGADTNTSHCAMIVGRPYTLGLWYNCESTRGFTLYQQTLNAAINGFGNTNAYARPTVDPLDRWTHVCAVFDRKTGYADNASEFWIDGVQQTALNRGMGGGRVKTDGVQIGGSPGTSTDGNNGHFADAEGKALSRTFPGVVDEVRIYDRKLTAAEIVRLARDPQADRPYAPVADGGVSETRFAVKGSASFTGLAAAGSNATLAYRWRVLRGDASAVVFATPTVRETTATVRKAGKYEVQLVVTDGAGQTVYSDPIAFETFATGTLISFR